MIKKQSYFKKPEENKKTFVEWVNKLEIANGYAYEKMAIQTGLGATKVFAFNANKVELETLVIFPGFRTSALIWDLDRGLFPLSRHLRIFMVETNGQPNLSDGNSPEIKSLDYGKWGAEVFEQLGIDAAYIAGASFGGLVCMKIALVIPNKIKGAFLLNPGCFRTISFGLKNLYFNILPILRPTAQNIQKFLNQIVFCKPEHQLSETGEDLLIEYQRLAITQYKDNTQKPYYMKAQLNDVVVETYLLVGENDILIPFQKSIQNARKHLKGSLKDVQTFKNAGHGIECYKPCLDYIEQTIKRIG